MRGDERPTCKELFDAVAEVCRQAAHETFLDDAVRVATHAIRALYSKLELVHNYSVETDGVSCVRVTLYEPVTLYDARESESMFRIAVERCMKDSRP